MRYLPNRFRRLRVAVGLVALLLVGAWVPVFADEVIGTATITGGPLTMAATAGPSFSATLNGSDQLATATISVSATDRRGSGEGWSLQITSTQFSTGGSDPRTLPATATFITGVTAACTTTTCITPANRVSYPLTVPAGSTPPTPEKFFTAAPDTGMGDFTVSPTFEVLIPSSAYAGTYTSVITITIASGS